MGRAAVSLAVALLLLLALGAQSSRAQGMLPFCTLDNDGIAVSRELVLDGNGKPQIVQLAADSSVRYLSPPSYGCFTLR